MTKSALLKSIAKTMADYREGEVPRPTAEHVDAWASQFDGAIQLPILHELDHVLKVTYISRASFEKFLSNLCRNTKIAGADPKTFWRAANFLDIQGGGASQTESLDLFSESLELAYGFGVEDCGSKDGPYIYLDDAVFSGNRVLNDIRHWLPNAPGSVDLHVVAAALHKYGCYYANKGIDEAFAQAGKTIKSSWWRIHELEDRKSYTDDSDVLRPASIPANVEVQAYAASLKYAPTLRRGQSVGGAKIFSSAAGRDVLEQAFLERGVHIRDICPFLNQYQRPLGNMVLQSLGFGSTIVTFRNCPNNCPLVFWAGDPWYPLFPRKTN